MMCTGVLAVATVAVEVTSSSEDAMNPGRRLRGDYRDRYRDMAKSLGFEGHIAWAEAMP